MRIFAFLFPWLLAMASCGSTQAAIVFNLDLRGSNEVPPNSSQATGSGTLILNDAQNQLSMNIVVNGIDFVPVGNPLDTGAANLSGMHIHNGLPGANGPIVFGLVGGGDNDANLVITPFAGGANILSTWDQAERDLAGQLSALLNNGLYFNVHTSAATGGFPGGEIRGQITAVPEPSSMLFCLGTVGLASFRRKRTRI